MTNVACLTILCVSVGVCIGALVPVDDFTTKNVLDDLVRKKMNSSVVQTFKIQETLEHQCVEKINSSNDQCNACAQRNNVTVPPSVDSSLIQPVLALVDLTKDIIVSPESPVVVLGEHIVDIGKDIGLNEALGKLPGTMAKVDGAIIDGVETAIHSIEHVGSSVINDIGHALGSIFGKRSSGNTCPICDTIDSRTRTSDDILLDVCGLGYMHQRVTGALRTKLKAIYNATLTKQIVTKVEYDNTSIDLSNGLSYNTVFVTYTITNVTTRYQSHVPLRFTGLEVTGDRIGEEIFAKETKLIPHV